MIMMDASVLLLTEQDPWGQPRGGQTTFAKHLVTAFGPRVAVTSYCGDPSIPTGGWVKRPYGVEDIWFFSRGRFHFHERRKPVIPTRITAYCNARKYLPRIHQSSPRNVLIDSPEMLFAAAPYRWDSVCYRFAGVNNPVSNSRYRLLRILGTPFERYMIRTLNRVNPDVMLAAADSASICGLVDRVGHALDRSRLYQFPTRVDTDLFRPMVPTAVRKQLGISGHATVLVATGRLCWIKGWDLLLEALVHIKLRIPDALLIFVGDGEDHRRLEERAEALGVLGNVCITGFLPQAEVVKYMNAADVCLVGSYREGWSLAMCEMLACGKAIVSTDISGARDMIRDSKNGYVVSNRGPEAYASAVLDAMRLEGAREESVLIAERYATKYLARDLGALWMPLGV
jgi:glycosyltransferase involved in cell wall biosynthesis